MSGLNLTSTLFTTIPFKGDVILGGNPTDSSDEMVNRVARERINDREVAKPRKTRFLSRLRKTISKIGPNDNEAKLAANPSVPCRGTSELPYNLRFGALLNGRVNGSLKVNQTSSDLCKKIQYCKSIDELFSLIKDSEINDKEICLICCKIKLFKTKFIFFTPDQKKIFEELIIKATSNLQESFNPVVVSVVCCCLEIEYDKIYLFYSVIDSIIINLPYIMESDLVNIVVTYTRCGIRNPVLFDKIADTILTRDLENFKPQHITNILWAYARNSIKNDVLFDKLADTILARDLRKFKPQHIAGALWAFTYQGKNPEILKYLLSHVFENIEKYSEVKFMQILQAYCELKYCLKEDIDIEISDRLIASFRTIEREVASSTFENEINSVLVEINSKREMSNKIHWYRNSLLEISVNEKKIDLYEIDFVVTDSKKGRTYFEIDGPVHDNLGSSDEIKDRQISAIFQEDKIVRLKYDDWNMAIGKREKIDLVKKCLGLF